jgi:hypothetical protein
MASSSATDKDLFRLEIQEFLDQAAARPDSPRICPNCGREMEYREVTFILYGTKSFWKIRVPVCDCEH